MVFRVQQLLLLTTCLLISPVYAADIRTLEPLLPVFINSPVVLGEISTPGTGVCVEFRPDTNRADLAYPIYITAYQEWYGGTQPSDTAHHIANDPQGREKIQNSFGYLPG